MGRLMTGDEEYRRWYVSTILEYKRNLLGVKLSYPFLIMLTSLTCYYYFTEGKYNIFIILIIIILFSMSIGRFLGIRFGSYKPKKRPKIKK